jgi:hypothetical protein
VSTDFKNYFMFMIDIYIITNVRGQRFYGDRNQVIAIKNALETLLSSCDVKIHEVDWHDIDQLMQYINVAKGVSLVVTSGNHGIEFNHCLALRKFCLIKC